MPPPQVVTPRPLAPEGGATPPDAAASPAEPSVEEPVSPVRVGGAWVRCYGNFRPSGQPARDVTRLGLMCGPSNGMRRIGDGSWTGEVAEGQRPFEASFRSVRGVCYRVFAVADAGVADLDVTIESSRGIAIASDHGEDAWPIVQPDRPFCVLEDDTLRVAISARRGRGHFAAEVWALGHAP